MFVFPRWSHWESFYAGSNDSTKLAVVIYDIPRGFAPLGLA